MAILLTYHKIHVGITSCYLIRIHIVICEQFYSLSQIVVVRDRINIESISGYDHYCPLWVAVIRYLTLSFWCSSFRLIALSCLVTMSQIPPLFNYPFVYN